MVWPAPFPANLTCVNKECTHLHYKNLLFESMTGFCRQSSYRLFGDISTGIHNKYLQAPQQNAAMTTSNMHMAWEVHLHDCSSLPLSLTSVQLELAGMQANRELSLTQVFVNFFLSRSSPNLKALFGDLFTLTKWQQSPLAHIMADYAPYVKMLIEAMTCIEDKNFP